MKTLIVFLIFLTISQHGVFSQQKKIKAYFSEKQFYAPEIGNYIELQLQFDGSTLNYNNKENGLIGEIAIIMKITKSDSIIASDAYRMQTPFMKDSIVEDFYEIKRFALKPGKYNFSLYMKDNLSKEDGFTFEKEIEILDLSKNIKTSDIVVAETASKGDGNSIFFKSGYDIIPRLSNYYPEELNFIPVYFEIYNTFILNSDVFGVKQKIIRKEDLSEVKELSQSYRFNTDTIIPFFKTINIENLNTGKYIINYSIISKDMIEVASNNYEFERVKDIEFSFTPDKIILNPAFQESISNDSILFYIASLIPISKPAESKNIFDILDNKDKEAARKYIQSYWLITSGTKSFEAWMKYKKQVDFIQKFYKTNVMAGFETDRGRVYLQYGPPSNIIQRDNTSNEYPYEIWQYNKISKYSNRQFIFYNPDMINNNYKLLHSDMIGEVKTNNWQYVLMGRSSNNGTITDPNILNSTIPSQNR